MTPSHEEQLENLAEGLEKQNQNILAPPTPTKEGGTTQVSYLYPLFEHMHKEHDMILLESELQEICRIVDAENALEQEKKQTVAVANILWNLLGQVCQLRDGHDIYKNSPSMQQAISDSSQILQSLNIIKQEKKCPKCGNKMTFVNATDFKGYSCMDTIDCVYREKQEERE